MVAGKSAFEFLYDLCATPDFLGRMDTMDVLVPKAGHHAIPLLTAVLKAGKAPERVHALRYLVDPRFMAKDLPGAAKAIAVALDDADERVTAHAIASLSAVSQEEDYFRALGPRLDATAPLIVRAVIDGMKRYKSDRTIEYLSGRFLAGPNPTRMLVLDAFFAIGDEKVVVPHLVDALTHRHIAIRTKATEAISQLAVAGKIDTAHTIVWLLRSRDTNVRRIATELVKRVGDKSGELTPKLLGFLRDEDWWVRERVMDALVEMAGATLARHLVEYLSDPSDVIRRFAIGGLVRLKDPRTIGTFVRAAMNDEDWWVREQAIEAIAELKDKRAIPYVVEILQRHPEQRLMCIQALHALEAAEAAPHVAPFVVDDDPDVRLAAVQCLAAIDGRDQAEVLEAARSRPGLPRPERGARGARALEDDLRAPAGRRQDDEPARPPPHGRADPGGGRSRPRRRAAAVREATREDGGAQQDRPHRRAGPRDPVSSPERGSARGDRAGAGRRLFVRGAVAQPPLPRPRLLAADRASRRSSGSSRTRSRTSRTWASRRS